MKEKQISIYNMLPRKKRHKYFEKILNDFSLQGDKFVSIDPKTLEVIFKLIFEKFDMDVECYVNKGCSFDYIVDLGNDIRIAVNLKTLNMDNHSFIDYQMLKVFDEKWSSKTKEEMLSAVCSIHNKRLKEENLNYKITHRENLIFVKKQNQIVLYSGFPKEIHKKQVKNIKKKENNISFDVGNEHYVLNKTWKLMSTYRDYTELDRFDLFELQTIESLVYQALEKI